jgi:ribosome maturation factor RimP
MRGVAPALWGLLESGVRALGFELVDVELQGGRQHSLLRVYIDGPQGITVDNCAKVSRQRALATGRKNFTGRLLEVLEDRVVIEVDNERFDLPFDDIERARLVPKIERKT